MKRENQYISWQGIRKGLNETLNWKIWMRHMKKILRKKVKIRYRQRNQFEGNYDEKSYSWLDVQKNMISLKEKHVDKVPPISYLRIK